MRDVSLFAAFVALAWGGVCFAETAAMNCVPPDLRGFGRVKVESFSHKEQKVSTLSFQCEDAQKAETVAGKFLMDLYAEDGATFKDGIHETKGGAAFAVERDGRTTTIYGAESRHALEDFFSHKEHKEALFTNANLCVSAPLREIKKKLVSVAAEQDREGSRIHSDAGARVDETECQCRTTKESRVAPVPGRRFPFPSSFSPAPPHPPCYLFPCAVAQGWNSTLLDNARKFRMKFTVADPFCHGTT